MKNFKNYEFEKRSRDCPLKLKVRKQDIKIMHLPAVANLSNS